MSLRSWESSNSAETFEAFFVGNTATTPRGTPARARSCARYSMVSGVFDAGFTIMVQPAARAGPSLRVPMAKGKFQGVMARQGPTGWWVTTIRPVPVGL